MNPGTLLVLGARKKSIGHAVGKLWADMFNSKVITAGISGEEDHQIDFDSIEEIVGLLREVEPSRILCTIGMNIWEGEYDKEELSFQDYMDDHLHTNVTIPMSVLNAWKATEISPAGAHFVALSSNSAHIPRSQSMAYCASKAALSMAIRCAARDEGKEGGSMSIYGWEPGLVKGTPMSGERAGTRMLGLPEGMPRRVLAQQIVNAMAFGGTEYNGVLVRLDAGEV